MTLLEIPINEIFKVKSPALFEMSSQTIVTAQIPNLPPTINIPTKEIPIKKILIASALIIGGIAVIRYCVKKNKKKKKNSKN